MIQVGECGSLSCMFPVLISAGKVSVSSFGVLLGAGFAFGLFLIWRLSRAWDLDEEKSLDLTILTFLGGLLGARIYFCIVNWPLFLSNPLSILVLYKAPGFSFWGGLLGGSITLYFFARRFRQDFWMALDIAAIGFIGGLIFANLGCFLGGCALGVPSNSFLAVSMVGVLGKRFPTQAMEAILLLLLLLNLWGKSIHFHPRGKILALSLIFVGLIKLLMEPLKASHSDLFLSLALSFLGIVIFYKVTSRNLSADLKNLGLFLYQLPTSSLTRQTAMARLKKYWYNQKTSFAWKMRNLKRKLSLKKILRRFNVRQRVDLSNNKLH